MTKIKYIETKEEWLKLILDGFEGVSNHTKEYEYECIVWANSQFMYDDGTHASINLHTHDFGIIEKFEEVELFEYIYKNLFGEWVTMWRLYTEEEIKVKLKDYEYKKTGRSFKVQKD